MDKTELLLEFNFFFPFLTKMEIQEQDVSNSKKLNFRVSFEGFHKLRRLVFEILGS